MSAMTRVSSGPGAVWRGTRRARVCLCLRVREPRGAPEVAGSAPALGCTRTGARSLCVCVCVCVRACARARAFVQHFCCFTLLASTSAMLLDYLRALQGWCGSRWSRKVLPCSALLVSLSLSPTHTHTHKHTHTHTHTQEGPRRVKQCR